MADLSAWCVWKCTLTCYFNHVFFLSWNIQILSRSFHCNKSVNVEEKHVMIYWSGQIKKTPLLSLTESGKLSPWQPYHHCRHKNNHCIHKNLLLDTSIPSVMIQLSWWWPSHCRTGPKGCKVNINPGTKRLSHRMANHHWTCQELWKVSRTARKKYPTLLVCVTAIQFLFMDTIFRATFIIEDGYSPHLMFPASYMGDHRPQGRLHTIPACIAWHYLKWTHNCHTKVKLSLFSY